MTDSVRAYVITPQLLLEGPFSYRLPRLKAFTVRYLRNALYLNNISCFSDFIQH